MVGVFGPVASGKTFLIKQYVRKMDRVVVFDTTWEYDDAVDLVIEGSPKTLIDYLIDHREHHRVAYVARDLSNGFGWAVETLWQDDLPRWLVVEEVHAFMSPLWKHPSMDALMRYSRKRNLGVIGTSQRVSSVHKDFCHGSRATILFGTSEPADVDAAADRFGASAGEQIQTIRRLEYNDATGSVGATPQILWCERGREPRVEDL
jgi:hypothetical protein